MTSLWIAGRQKNEGFDVRVIEDISMTSTKKTVVGNIDPDVLAFTVGKDALLDAALTEYDCIGSAAHVTMLSRMPRSAAPFDLSARRCIIAELVEVMRDARRGNFEITQSDQDVHLAVERRLTDVLGDLGKKIHTGRSRNDQVAVDLRLYSRTELLGLVREVVALALAFLDFARKHERLPMVGRTHLQPAMPSSVGLWASGYAEALLDDLIIVNAAYEYNDRCPLGSAAGYGVPLPVDRALTARLLAFSAPHHNVLYASNARGKCEGVILSALAQLMLTLSRLSEDLILYTMPEFGYFTIPREFCTGSSIMPQKNNPDVLELVRAKAGRIQGLVVSVACILKALPGGYNRDLQETKELLMEGFATTRASMRILGRLMDGLDVCPDALRGAFSPGVFATDRAIELVSGGMPFREAYYEVRMHLDELSNADPDAAVAAKTHLGGTAGLDLKMLRQRCRDYDREAVRRDRAQNTAFKRLLGVSYPSLESISD